MWNSLRKDLIRFLREPTAILMAIAIPLVVAIILKVAFGGGGGGSPTAKLLVADQDETIASSLLVAALGQGPLQDMLETVAVTEDDGRRQLNQGDASALLIIPAGMGENLLQDLPDTLWLVTNPAQSILPQLVTSIMTTLADAVFYGQRLVGDDLRPLLQELVDSGQLPTVEQVSELFPVVERTAGKVGAMVENPPLVLIKKTVETAPQVSVGEIMLPAMLLMGLLFMAQGLSGDLWVEREQGTLRRIVTSASSIRGWLLGKAGAVFVCSGILAFLGLALARFAFSIDVHHVFLGALWMAWTGAALFLFFVVLQVLARSRRGGGILSSLVVFPLAMLGGSFFPFEAMPQGLASLGAWTPNGSAIQGLKGIMQSSITWEVQSLLVVSGVLVGSFLFTLWKLRRSVERGEA